LTDPFGEGSPLAQLYALSARVLLLGVGYDSCTALHLAERRAFGDQQACEYTGSPILLNDQRTWVEYSAPLVDDADFTKLGQTFEDNGPAVLKGRVGLATARLIPLVALVDFAKGWLAAHRSPDGASPPRP
jgi:aminoglycoside 3-N-acetyltransferase